MILMLSSRTSSSFTSPENNTSRANFCGIRRFQRHFCITQHDLLNSSISNVYTVHGVLGFWGFGVLGRNSEYFLVILRATPHPLAVDGLLVMLLLPTSLLLLLLQESLLRTEGLHLR